jgi:hypothetical protein
LGHFYKTFYVFTRSLGLNLVSINLARTGWLIERISQSVKQIPDQGENSSGNENGLFIVCQVFFLNSTLLPNSFIDHVSDVS